MSETYSQATELLLASISQDKSKGLQASFFVKKPSDPFHHMGLGVEIYYDFTRLHIAALYVRQHGPAYLRFLSIENITSMLQEIVRENYYILVEDTYLKWKNDYLDKIVSVSSKKCFAEALAESFIFQPDRGITLFPLVPLQIHDDFISETFSITSPDSLTRKVLIPHNIHHGYNIDAEIIAQQFPPLRDWNGRRHTPSAWLAVSASIKQVSLKMRSAILGSIALTPTPTHRYMFSERVMFGGLCTFGKSMTIFPHGVPHTPGLMHDIVLTAEDHEWLTIMSKVLSSENRDDRRKLKALEYFYRAWSLDSHERFPILCMALDALFGHTQNATQAVIDGLRSVLGANTDDKRLRLLMKIRAAVIHGGAPDVYDSSNYEKYFKKYKTDPIRDMELITAKSLSKVIFTDYLRSHPNPHEEVISKKRASGDLPPAIPSILD